MSDQASQREQDREKEVKVRIPASCHVRLQAVKILTGKQISETVTEALREYFRAHPDLGAFDGDALVDGLGRAIHGGGRAAP